MKKIVLIFTAAFLFTACSAPGTFKVSGKIKNAKNEKVYLEQITGEQVIQIDSASLDESGQFSFKERIEEPGIYRLNLNNERAIDLCIKSDDQIKIDADKSKGVAEYQVEGSAASLEIKNMNQMMINAFDKIRAMQEEFKNSLTANNRDSLMAAMDLRYKTLVETETNKLKTFLESSKNAFVKVYGANYLDPSIDLPFISKIRDAVKNQKETYFSSFFKKVEMLEFLAVGKEAPEIALPDVNGKVLKLSSFRGKYVLIDFWASWCGPCRQENPNVVQAYNKYKSKGLEIFGVSLDRTKDKWVNAIKQDNISWVQVSDLMFWDSQAAKDYRIESIPATFLLDKEGKILAKNLRGQDLEDFLEKLLNK